MATQRKQFPFSDFEPKWQHCWLEDGSFRATDPGDPGFDPARPKTYILDMFPYPSGDGLHIGHPLQKTACDIVARQLRMRGHNVLFPAGWDSFGLPAEQYAIKTGQHPRVTTEANIANFTRQLKQLGFSYDWSREFATSEPDYYKWTQWIFLQIYGSYFDENEQKARPITQLPIPREIEALGAEAVRDYVDSKRLAYVDEQPVNWSPDLGTVLANEEVGEWTGKGFRVERRPMRQWMLRITAYAQRLIDELEPLDWPESLKLMQRNWIGRSAGALVEFRIAECEPSEARQIAASNPEGESSRQSRIEVFTTRPDTLFGATYLVLAPEHPLVGQITTKEHRAAVADYKKQISSKSDLERTELSKDKTGIPTGAFAINPVNGEKIPLWIADYVMMGYGTGAIMAVPAHDERDFEFAQKFGLPIRQVVQQSSGIGFQPMRQLDKIAIREGANLPHWTQDSVTYAVTFRLADSLPQHVLAELAEDRRHLLAKAERGQALTPTELADWKKLFREKIEVLLDAGHGACSLRDPKIAEMVESALKHFDGERYDLLAWCIMPNHVHAIFTPRDDEDLSGILHSWKSFTANKANEVLERSGDFWQRESFDHIIRDAEEFHRQIRYVLANPAKAGLGDLKWCGVKETHQQDADATTSFTGEGLAVNSGFLDGLPTAEAKKQMIAWLEKNTLGRGTINYKLRDWLFSRQRYWGEPFPIVWKNGRHYAIPESELPLLPPDLEDFKPAGDGRPPLAKATDWVQLPDGFERETNTMPQWAGSCWYHLRFLDAENPDASVDAARERYWMQPHGVDLYVGGVEHAVLHLLYARFWHKVLFDLGQVSTPEPFFKLVNQGLILGEDGQKMSKSRGNVINPDDVVTEFGADSLRLFEMFMGPFDQVKPWSQKGVEGLYRFLARVWRLAMEENQEGEWIIAPTLTDSDLTSSQLRVVQATIKKVTEDIAAFSFNTAIAQMMVCTNEFVNANPRPVGALRVLLPLLSPFAPHLAEELWERLAQKFPGFDGRASTQPWPVHEEKFLVVDEVEYGIQVNGKVRDRVTVRNDATDSEIEQTALALPKVQEAIAGKTVAKVIVIRGKLVNIVAR